jgi:hypothetical protein
MARSINGITCPSSLATYSSFPGLTSASTALSAETLDLHPLASSKDRHKTSKTRREPSAGQILTSALIALVTALRTDCPLSMLKLTNAGIKGMKTPSTPVPRDLDSRSIKTGAPSRSEADFDEAQMRTTSTILASCRACRVVGDFLRTRAIESAMDLASTLFAADASAVSCSATIESGRGDT